MLSWDYCYLSTREDAEAAGEAVVAVEGPEFSAASPVLAMWDNKGKGLHAHIVHAKGVDYEGLDKVVKMLSGDLDRLGWKRVVFRSDHEAAISALLRELGRSWHGEVVPEEAATRDPQSNGAAENGVKLIKGRVRTLKDALEFNLGAEVPPTSGLMSLLVKQAASSY